MLHNVGQQVDRFQDWIQQAPGIGCQLDVKHVGVGRREMLLLEMLLLGIAQNAYGRPCA